MKKTPILLPRHRKVLAGLGENLKLARLRRRLSAEQVAERAGISRATLYHIERGSPNVAMGSYFLVMRVLGLEGDFARLGADDALGRRLQDASLVTKQRAPKRKGPGGNS